MTENPDSQAAQTARLCDRLPEFEAAADEHGWSDLLAALLADLRKGDPLADALARHGLPPIRDAAPGRGAPVDLSSLIDPVPVRGEYRCPLDRPCSRRGSVDPGSGEEPRCDVAGLPMRFSAMRRPR